ncbi:unnamed protein product, partial [Effrenium voratum]
WECKLGFTQRISWRIGVAGDYAWWTCGVRDRRTPSMWISPTCMARKRAGSTVFSARTDSSSRSGRAEVLHLESSQAAAQMADGELDFVYLDARHDFAGVVADIHAWWPKVRLGGIFAGHDFVDGEFPEGDFFWISALQEALPGLGDVTHIIRETNRYPSFFIVKTSNISGLTTRQDSEALALQLYAGRSKYFRLWLQTAGRDFHVLCNDLCGVDCSQRVANFTPSRTAVSTLRPFACGQETCGVEVMLDASVYKQVCLERCSVTCQQRLELFTAHGEKILAQGEKDERAAHFRASVPGMRCREAAQAMLAGIESSVVNKNETSEIVDAYVTATWGDEASYTSDSFDGVMISTPPQQASVQYSIGMLWGYAIRGVAKRLALDRQLGTVPELVSAQRLQLERALDLNFNESSNGPPTFLQYASEFFSHEDWADLCRPSNVAVNIMEAELQEAMHAVAILSSVSQDGELEVISSSEEEFENDFELDMVLLDQAEWKGFQYRAVVYGCLLADAEAFVGSEVGLERSERSWVRALTKSRALSEPRPEQGGLVAASVAMPLRRVVQALKGRVLATKLREARQSSAPVL